MNAPVRRRARCFMESEKNMTERKVQGRPRQTREGGMNVLIYIPKELREQLRELGGSKWIAEQIKKTMPEKQSK